MSVTNAYAAKRGLFALLGANNGPGGVLEDIQVAYTQPAAPEMRCIYGGGVRFEHRDDIAEGPGVLIAEAAYVGVYVRVLCRPALSVLETDEQAQEIADVMVSLVRANAKLGGPLSWVGIRQGQGDYAETDDESISVIGFEFRFDSKFGY